jgi:hypothetical protein
MVVVGGIYSPHHQINHWGWAAVDGRTGQSGAPATSPNREGSDGFDRWSYKRFMAIRFRKRFDPISLSLTTHRFMAIGSISDLPHTMQKNRVHLILNYFFPIICIGRDKCFHNGSRSVVQKVHNEIITKGFFSTLYSLLFLGASFSSSSRTISCGCSKILAGVSCVAVISEEYQELL